MGILWLSIQVEPRSAVLKIELLLDSQLRSLGNPTFKKSTAWVLRRKLLPKVNEQLSRNLGVHLQVLGVKDDVDIESLNLNNKKNNVQNLYRELRKQFNQDSNTTQMRLAFVNLDPSRVEGTTTTTVFAHHPEVIGHNWAIGFVIVLLHFDLSLDLLSKDIVSRVIGELGVGWNDATVEQQACGCGSDPASSLCILPYKWTEQSKNVRLSAEPVYPDCLVQMFMTGRIKGLIDGSQANAKETSGDAICGNGLIERDDEVIETCDCFANASSCPCNMTSDCGVTWRVKEHESWPIVPVIVGAIAACVALVLLSLCITWCCYRKTGAYLTHRAGQPTAEPPTDMILPGAGRIEFEVPREEAVAQAARVPTPPSSQDGKSGPPSPASSQSPSNQLPMQQLRRKSSSPKSKGSPPKSSPKSSSQSSPLKPKSSASPQHSPASSKSSHDSKKKGKKTVK